MTTTTNRPLYQIAADIRKNWTKVYFGAVPYLQAMETLTDATSNYGCDSAKSIVLYFLSNATGFRGATARQLKQELKDICGLK